MMDKINWDLAPEGAVAIKQDCGKWKNVTWVNDKGEWWDDSSCCWSYDFTPDEWVQTIAVRPVHRKKTVVDVYNYYGSEFPFEDDCVLGIAYSNEEKIIPYYKGSPLAEGTNSPESYIICTREELEAYAKEQGSKKESEKWTHLVNGSECVLLDENKDCDGYYIVKTHYGAFELAKEHELRPIKPKLTKAEAWDKAVLTGNTCNVTHKYEIID